MGGWVGFKLKTKTNKYILKDFTAPQGLKSYELYKYRKMKPISLLALSSFVKRTFVDLYAEHSKAGFRTHTKIIEVYTSCKNLGM
jgi:hypothetical protein